MSRNGSGIYSAPAGTTAVSGTTIESAKYNAFVADLVADANLARPIVAGGTGATTAAGILAATGVTASVAEVNALDGITASTAELNILDGVTASAAELNILDGATLTVTELNYVDGVTSAIQTQLNAKVAVIADPGADRIRFWDDSAGAEAYLEIGTGLAITGTTLALSAPTGGLELVETIATTSGTSITTTVAWVAGYDYFLNLEEVEHNAGVNRDFQYALFGATAGAYSSTFTDSNGINGDGRYGWLGIMEPGFSRNDFDVWMRSGNAGTAASSNVVLNTGAFGAYVHWAVAQTVTGARITLSGAGSFNKGAVRVYRRAV